MKDKPDPPPRCMECGQFLSPKRINREEDPYLARRYGAIFCLDTVIYPFDPVRIINMASRGKRKRLGKSKPNKSKSGKRISTIQNRVKLPRELNDELVIRDKMKSSAS